MGERLVSAHWSITPTSSDSRHAISWLTPNTVELADNDCLDEGSDERGRSVVVPLLRRELAPRAFDHSGIDAVPARLKAFFAEFRQELLVPGLDLIRQWRGTFPQPHPQDVQRPAEGEPLRIE